MEYESRVNERQIQTTEEKTDTRGKEISGNDAHVDDADIRPINNDEPMAEVQTTAEINIFATGQQHTEQPEFNIFATGQQHTNQYLCRIQYL
ncbi:hypothetical protein Tco_0330401 [Tanacetum coccineum]